MRGFRGYADADGACSNRNALPVCVTRHSRQSATQSSCRAIKVESAASFESRGTTMRLRIRPHPAIFRRRTLTTATSAGAATSSLWPPPPPASQRARRTRAPLVGIACAGAIPLQQPSNRTISPRSGGGTVARKGGPHNIASPALRKVNRDRPHYLYSESLRSRPRTHKSATTRD